LKAMILSSFLTPTNLQPICQPWICKDIASYWSHAWFSDSF
jgi:hypothetical protein